MYICVVHAILLGRINKATFGKGCAKYLEKVEQNTWKKWSKMLGKGCTKCYIKIAQDFAPHLLGVS
jgi:hypothetical protein